MSVLKHEGTVPILFGSTSVTVGTMTRNGYLARPGLSGRFPTVVVVPGARGLSSNVKDVCRRLARWGIAAAAIDPYRGSPPPVDADAAGAEEAFRAVSDGRLAGDVRAFVRFITNPAGFWSNAEDGFGMVGLGSGGRIAAIAAAADGSRPAALAVVSAPLRKPDEDGPVYPSDLLTGLGMPILGLYGKADPEVPVDDVMAARVLNPAAEWVLYPDAGHTFYDDDTAGYDLVAASDAMTRLVAFFERHLPSAG